jgi:hypothetical protein
MQFVVKIWNRARMQSQSAWIKHVSLAYLAIVAGIWFGASDVAGAQSLTFMGNTYVGPDLDPTCVVALDIFGRGKPDLIGVDSGGTLFQIFTNNGYGSFGSNSLISFSSAQATAVVADVNGDGKPDLIFANGTTPGLLTVLTNNGSGGFGSNATLSVGYAPKSLTAADVNGDHKIDLISADLYSGTLTVYTNNGIGAFGLSGTYNAGSDPYSVIAADLNDDGKMDLVCADEYGNTVTILTNNGAGVFGSNATCTVGSEPMSVAAVDLNGNGKLALVTANYGFSEGNTLTVLTNNGSGVYGSNATLVVGNGPISVVAADMNGDGKPDLICANSQDNTLTVLTNNGAGGFGMNTLLFEGENPQCVMAADVNGDGRLDLISGDEYTGMTVQTQVGFTAWRYAVGGGPDCIVATNIINANPVAVVSANAASSTLTVLTNNGVGIFGSNATLHVSNGAGITASGDFNGDGRPDLVCVNSGGAGSLTILTNNGNGGFGSNTTFSVGSTPDCVAPVDVNGNGRLALAVTANGELLLCTNNGADVFGVNATLETGNVPGFVVAADVNGDHQPDLIVANKLNHTLVVFLNNGGGGYVSNGTYTVGLNPIAVVAADVNGDGKPDLISVNEQDSTVTVLTNSGGGIFVSNATYFVGTSPLGSSPISAVAADINGDGWPDLIVVNSGANEDASSLTILTNNGSGVFGLYANITTDTQAAENSGPDYITTADVNGDGKPDLIVAESSGTVTVLINTIAPPTALAPLLLGSTFSGANGLVLSWSSLATNIVIQTNADLTGTNWETANYSITTTNGTNQSVTITPAPGALFFRLKQ